MLGPSQRRYRAKNPDKVKAWRKAYYWRHRERLRREQAAKTAARAALMKEYRQRPEVKERIKATSKIWRALHKERIATIGRTRRALHPDYNRAWKKAHPEAVNDVNQRRRARIRNAPRVEKINRKLIFARDRNLCHICGLKVRPEDRSLDHLIPLAHGGNHTEDNVALAHRRCNSRRGTGRLPAQLRLFG